MIGLWVAGKLSFFVAVFILIFLLKGSLCAQHRNSLEFSPDYALKMFTANDQVSGEAFGWEMMYSLNSVNKTKDWRHILRVESVDLILNVQNMRQVSVFRSTDQLNPLSCPGIALH